MHRTAGWRRRLATAALAGLLAATAVAVSGSPLAAQTEGEGRWETTAPLSVPRYDHTTTLLVGGKVLVAAGQRVVAGEPTTLLRSAEVYDPHAERWRPTGALSDARWSHTATLLPDGRVLVAGGFGDPYRAASNAQPVLDSAEIYDPRTGRWTPTPSMGTRRALHTATLLPDGAVLVAGGRTCDQPPPAACNFTFRTATAEIFHPEAGTWTPVGPLLEDRHTTSAVLLDDGTVLIPAGFSSAGTSATAEILDPATGTSSSTGSLNRARARQGAMLLPDGRVLVASGFLGDDTAELYDPATGAWSFTGDPLLTGPSPQPARRFNFHFAVLPNGEALMAGGATFPPSGRTRSAELFDPATGRWSWAAEMHDEHGSGSSLSNSAAAVVLSSDPWTLEARPEVCAPHCGKVLVAGNSPNATVELYTPACPDRMPAAPQQLACVGDGPAAERPGRPTEPHDGDPRTDGGPRDP